MSFDKNKQQYHYFLQGFIYCFIIEHTYIYVHVRIRQSESQRTTNAVPTRTNKSPNARREPLTQTAAASMRQVPTWNAPTRRATHLISMYKLYIGKSKLYVHVNMTHGAVMGRRRGTCEPSLPLTPCVASAEPPRPHFLVLNPCHPEFPFPQAAHEELELQRAVHLLNPLLALIVPKPIISLL